MVLGENCIPTSNVGLLWKVWMDTGFNPCTPLTEDLKPPNRFVSLKSPLSHCIHHAWPHPWPGCAVEKLSHLISTLFWFKSSYLCVYTIISSKKKLEYQTCPTWHHLRLTALHACHADWWDWCKRYDSYFLAEFHSLHVVRAINFGAGWSKVNCTSPKLLHKSIALQNFLPDLQGSDGPVLSDLKKLLQGKRNIHTSR